MKLTRVLLLSSLAGLLSAAVPVRASRIIDWEIPSASMHKSIHADVVLPDDYRPDGAAWPVVYLLHGFSGNYTTWVKDIPVTASLADRYQVILVCPDGGYSSWYWDSPVDPTMKYETHVIDEVVPFVDQHYHTIRDRRGRAITGFSMGGHGALYLAFRHQDIFGAAGSTSGGVDIRPFPNSWEMTKRLGDEASHPENWESHSVINLIHLLHEDHLALIIDCGTDDFFAAVNRRLHEELRYRNIPHDYIERPGKHDGDYWNNSIDYQVLFFRKFFDRGAAAVPPAGRS